MNNNRIVNFTAVKVIFLTLFDIKNVAAK